MILIYMMCAVRGRSVGVTNVTQRLSHTRHVALVLREV